MLCFSAAPCSEPSPPSQFLIPIKNVLKYQANVKRFAQQMDRYLVPYSSDPHCIQNHQGEPMIYTSSTWLKFVRKEIESYTVTIQFAANR